MSSIITGLGVVAPTGIGVKDYWEATLAGLSGIRTVTRFDATGYNSALAGEVDRFDTESSVPSRLLPQTDRWTHLALAASDLALQDADVCAEALPEYAGAVLTSSSSGGTDFGQREMSELYRNGPGYVSAYQSIAWFYAATTGQLSIHHRLRGASGVFAAEQAGGLVAIDRASRMVSGADPDVRITLTGGTDSALCPYALVAQQASGCLSTQRDPAKAYLPFSTQATGHVPGEGGALLVVEREGWRPRHAAGAYARILGCASTFDPAPRLGLPSALSAAVRQALTAAEVTPSEIDGIFADGAATLSGDNIEATTIRAIFGASVPVTVPKAGTGRLYGGGGSLDVACAALSLHHGALPPIPNASSLDPGYRITFITDTPLTTDLRNVVIIARGFGGFNAAMVLGRYQEVP